MATITIERKLLEQALVALSAPNHCVFSEPPICVDIRAALAAPATAPDERIKELEAELAATEIAIAEYRQQCLDNAAEIARLKSESEERLQNCMALVAENERLRQIAHLIGSIFVYGNFVAETHNERVLEKLLRENGTFWGSVEQYEKEQTSTP